MICYYQSWSSSSFAPSDIDANICTHVNYAFLGIKSDGSLRLDGDDSKFPSDSYFSVYIQAFRCYQEAQRSEEEAFQAQVVVQRGRLVRGVFHIFIGGG